jgi:hypothetical protein
MTTIHNNTSGLNPPAPSQKARSFAGIEPGSLKGSRIELGPTVDPDEEIRD